MNKIVTFIFGLAVGGVGVFIGDYFYYKDKMKRIESRVVDICMDRLDIQESKERGA